MKKNVIQVFLVVLVALFCWNLTAQTHFVPHVSRIGSTLTNKSFRVPVKQKFSPTQPGYSIARTNRGAAQKIEESVWVVGDRGKNHREWLKVTTVQDPGGKTHTKTNLAYIELATSGWYREEGEWKESRELIEPFPGGATARSGNHKVIFANNLNTVGAIDMETSDGKRLKSNVVGVEYFDTDSGRSVLIGEVQDADGQIISSNQVIYANAFKGIKADVRYTYRRFQFEQDIILREMPPTPEQFGLNPDSTVMEVLTEFIEFPSLKKTTKSIRLASQAEIVDEELDFGEMKMGPGNAFLLNQQDSGIAVSKQFLTIQARKFLVEQVPFVGLKKRLDALPKKRASLSSDRMYKIEQKRCAPIRACLKNRFA